MAEAGSFLMAEVMLWLMYIAMGKIGRAHV